MRPFSSRESTVKVTIVFEKPVTSDSLEEKGLIRRIRGNDRRIYYAKLTEKGKEKYLELREKMRNKISDAFDKLKPEEKEQFSRCVETISALLDKIT